MLQSTLLLLYQLMQFLLQMKSQSLNHSDNFSLRFTKLDESRRILGNSVHTWNWFGCRGIILSFMQMNTYKKGWDSPPSVKTRCVLVSWGTWIQKLLAEAVCEEGNALRCGEAGSLRISSIFNKRLKTVRNTVSL